MMRHEVRSVVALVVALQFVASLRTFPYLVELVLVPIAVLLGRIKPVANHSDEHRAVRPVEQGVTLMLRYRTKG